MTERSLAERQEGQRDSPWVATGRGGQVRSAEVGGRTNAGQQILDERQVQHLLRRDVRNRPPPAFDYLQLGRRYVLLDSLLEGESRVQVLAHGCVLELGGQAQHVDKRLTVFDDKRRLWRSSTPTRG